MRSTATDGVYTVHIPHATVHMVSHQVSLTHKFTILITPCSHPCCSLHQPLAASRIASISIQLGDTEQTLGQTIQIGCRQVPLLNVGACCRTGEMAISPCATECKHYAPVTAHLHAIFSRTIGLRAMFTTLLTPTRRSPLPQQPTPVPPSTATAVRQPLHFTGHLPLEAHFAQWGREYGRLSTQQQFCPALTFCIDLYFVCWSCLYDCQARTYSTCATLGT